MRPTALVTGAASGIGRAVAVRLARDGHDVVATDRDEEGARHVAEEVGGRAFTLDVRSEEAWTQVLDAVGELDVLVQAAGVTLVQPLDRFALEDFRRVLAVNLEGAVLGVARAAPRLRDGGCIVNVASLSGHRAHASSSAYCASKAALLMFTRCAALELAPRLRVLSVSPGLIRTPMWTSAPFWSGMVEQAGSEEAAWAALARETPLGRVASSEEVADLVAWAVSPAASFVTGTDLAIDGGYGAR